MRQRLDIADVEARTKIRAKYLRALENEEFGLLPGSTFVRTFLRTYAELLGLDPHRLVEEYRTNYETGEELDVQPIGAPAASGRRDRPTRDRRGGGPPSRMAIFGMAAIVLLVFLIVLGLTSGNESKKGDKESASSAAKRKRANRRHKPAAPVPALVTLRIVPDAAT